MKRGEKTRMDSKVAPKSETKPVFKCLRSRPVYMSKPISKRRHSHLRFFGHGQSQCNRWMPLDKNRPPNPAIVAALDYYNENSDQKYQLLRPGSITPVPLDKCILYHVDFVAKISQVDDAPEELFFAEIIYPEGTVDPCVRLCVSLGRRRDSISGDRLNGCRYCRRYNNVWHPEGGGFVRGHDLFYKSVQDICDPDMLKQVSRAWDPTEENFDNASLYATEVVNFMNQTNNKKYEVVKSGFATRVFLTQECSLIHLNFKAKETDPSAPVKSFFAELTLTTTSGVTTGGVYSFECCLELDLSEMKLGKLMGDKINGCYFCHGFNKVRHPTDGGFVRGGDSLYKPELEFLCL